MTLHETTSSAGLPRRGLQRTLAIGLLTAAQAVSCASSRPAQRAASAASSPAVAPSAVAATPHRALAAEQVPAQQDEQAVSGEKTASAKGPEPQALPAATSAAAPTVGGQDRGDKIPDGAIVGKIVSSFRGDDGKMTLYLDQGSKSKIRVNMRGNILEGGEGGKKLDGGAFTITKVLGDNQSVAETNYGKGLGKNHRFMIIRPE